MQVHVEASDAAVLRVIRRAVGRQGGCAAGAFHDDPAGGATQLDLGDYMRSLDRMLESEPEALYPAHGPRVAKGRAKIREYIDHRLDRDRQILAALAEGAGRVSEIVKIVYAAYPESLYPAAGQSVASHLLKLEREGLAARESQAPPLECPWRVAG